MEHYKDKGMDKGKANVADLCESTRDHPFAESRLRFWCKRIARYSYEIGNSMLKSLIY